MAVSKNSVQIADLHSLPAFGINKMTPMTSYDGPWVNILQAPIHTSMQKDLIIGVSLECGLFTDTSVSSQLLNKVSAQSEACIEVQVLLDGLTLDQFPFSGPNKPVIFNRRSQTLVAQFAGMVTTDPVTGVITVTDEFLELILDTTEANAFNWVAANVGQGDHVVSVQSRISIKSNASSGGNAVAAGGVGWGSLTVEEVRLVKSATPLNPLTP